LIDGMSGYLLLILLCVIGGLVFGPIMGIYIVFVIYRTRNVHTPSGLGMLGIASIIYGGFTGIVVHCLIIGPVICVLYWRSNIYIAVIGILYILIPIVSFLGYYMYKKMW